MEPIWRHMATGPDVLADRNAKVVAALSILCVVRPFGVECEFEAHGSWRIYAPEADCSGRACDICERPKRCA